MSDPCALQEGAEDFIGFEELAGDFGRDKKSDRIYWINWMEESRSPTNPV